MRIIDILCREYKITNRMHDLIIGISGENFSHNQYGGLLKRSEPRAFFYI